MVSEHSTSSGVAAYEHATLNILHLLLQDAASNNRMQRLSSPICEHPALDLGLFKSTVYACWVQLHILSKFTRHLESSHSSVSLRLRPLEPVLTVWRCCELYDLGYSNPSALLLRSFISPVSGHSFLVTPRASTKLCDTSVSQYSAQHNVSSLMHVYWSLGQINLYHGIY